MTGGHQPVGRVRLHEVGCPQRSIPIGLPVSQDGDGQVAHQPGVV